MMQWLSERLWNTGQEDWTQRFWMPQKELEQDKVLVYLVRGLLVFMTVFGCVGGILSEFGIAYNKGMTGGFILAAGLILAFLRSNRWLNSLGLFGLFLAYLFLILQYRAYAYSGFQVFYNTLNQEYSDYFRLSVGRQADVLIDDPYKTVTITAMFIGFFICLLMNNIISNHMSLRYTVLLTAPILMAGLYIRKPPEPVYYFMLLASYAIIAVLGGSGHTAPSPAHKPAQVWKQLKRRKRTRLWRQEAVSVCAYYVKGSIWLPIVGICLVVTIFFMVLTGGLYGRISEEEPVNALKAVTDEYLKIFVSQGVEGFGNRYAARGGISQGQLGGVSGVQPTYQTDLAVYMVPYGYDSIYLRAYLGAYYTGHAWLEADTVWGVSGNDMTAESSFLERRFASGEGMRGIMGVEVIMADPELVYKPYYTAGQAESGFPGYSMSFYPYADAFIPELTALMSRSGWERDIDAEMQSYVHNYEYTSAAPQGSSLALWMSDFVKEAGEPVSYQDAIGKVRDYLWERYPYSQNPGKTPENADFVDFFLTEQREGYCAHFASAAVLMFRAYGIPARYAEGYVIQPYLLADAVAVEEEDTPVYLEGDIPVSIDELGILKVEVPDAAAHAWVELYVEGFGWVPVEVTPPSANQEYEGESLMGFFTRLFSVQNQDGNIQAGLLSDLGWGTGGNRGQGIAYLDIPFMVLSGIGGIWIGILIWKKGLGDRVRVYRSYRKGEYEAVLAYHYRRLVRSIHKKRSNHAGLPDALLPLQTAEWLHGNAKEPAVSETAESFMRLFEACYYSGQPIDQGEAHDLIRFFKKAGRMKDEKKQ